MGVAGAQEGLSPPRKDSLGEETFPSGRSRPIRWAKPDELACRGLIGRETAYLDGIRPSNSPGCSALQDEARAATAKIINPSGAAA
jgi:hypothetical protein